MPCPIPSSGMLARLRFALRVFVVVWLCLNALAFAVAGAAAI